ncbi:MAG: ABC transporter substrate-binding protein [Sphingobacteriaceae bacterium]
MIKTNKLIIKVIILLSLASCQSVKKEGVPTIGFVDAFEDATIAEAKKGFIAALSKNGFNEDKKQIKIIYRNAQGSIPTLTQIVDYYLSEKVDLLATSTTLSTISAIQKTRTTPIFMMVSPTAKLMKVEDASGKVPANLFGVSENLEYIDTAFSIIPKLISPKSKKLLVGMIYNQAEPQSVDAVNRIRSLAAKLNVALETMPVNSSADALLVTRSLLNKNIDAFFANPDNTVFASFETILKSCDTQGVPIFTSESGLVKRGAVAAFGADIYQWGFQAGEQASIYLKTGKTNGLNIEIVKIRKRVYNKQAADKYKLRIPAAFEAI